jgi:putative ABC transport system ATP-binding protein
MNRERAESSRPRTDALRLVGVTKIYAGAQTAVPALDRVTLTLPSGTFTAVMGPSGSGKSTLLQCAAGLDRPSQGRVFVGGKELPTGGEAELTKFRRGRIGFVFQQYNLVPYLTVQQNVDLPQRLAGQRVDRGATAAILTRLGLTALSERRPAELSGGQQQRVAIARALVSRHSILFADEPTGALDTTSSRQVLGLLREAVRELGQTVLMVTHDPVAAAHADAALFLVDGAIVDRLPEPTVAAVAERMTHLEARVDETRRGSSDQVSAP